MSVMMKEDCKDSWRATTACLLTVCQDEINGALDPRILTMYMNSNSVGIVRL